MRKRRKRSVFIPLVLGYAILAAVALWLIGDRFNEGVLKLMLLGFFPIVLAGWIRDALVRGVLWRQGARSLTEASTMNEQRVSRSEQPVRYWLAIATASLLATALALFVVIGIVILLTSVE